MQLELNKKLIYARMDIGRKDPGLLMLLSQYPIMVEKPLEKGGYNVGFMGFSTDKKEIVLNEAFLQNMEINNISAVIVHELLHILLGHHEAPLVNTMQSISNFNDQIKDRAFANIIFDIVVNEFVGKYYDMKNGLTHDLFDLHSGMNYKEVGQKLKDALQDVYILDLRKEADFTKFKELHSEKNKKVFEVGVAFNQGMVYVISELFVVFEWPKVVVLFPYSNQKLLSKGSKIAKEIVKRSTKKSFGIMKDLMERGIFDLEQRWDLVHLIRRLIGMNSLKFKKKLRLNREDRRGFIKKSKVLKLRIFLAIDTSLSITEKELKTFMSMIKPLRTFCDLDIVFFSTDIWLRIPANSPMPDKITIQSGGTLYGPVFDEATKKPYDMKIMVTDGYPADKDTIRDLNDCKWVFALSDSGNLKLFNRFNVYLINGLYES